MGAGALSFALGISLVCGASLGLFFGWSVGALVVASGALLLWPHRRLSFVGGGVLLLLAAAVLWRAPVGPLIGGTLGLLVSAVLWRPALLARGPAALTAVSALLGLSAGEVGLRLLDPRGLSVVADTNMVDDLLFDPEGSPARPFRPNMRLVAGQTVYSTNALGLRSPPVSGRLLPETPRVLLVGDSFSFGWGVSDDQTFARLASGLLSERRPVELINGGVAHANTETEAALATAFVPSLRPALVVLQWLNNDCDPEDPWQELRVRDRWLDPEPMLTALRYTLVVLAWAAEPFESADGYEAPEDGLPGATEGLCRDPTRTAAVMAALDRLRTLGPELRILVVEENQGIAAYCAQYHLACEAVRERLPPLAAVDAHPNAEGHLVLARALVRLVLAGPLRPSQTAATP
jgi:hypothetical protein